MTFTLATSIYIAHLLDQVEQASMFIEEAEALSCDVDSKVALCHALMVRAMVVLDRGAPTSPWLPEVLALGRHFDITNFLDWHDLTVVRLATHVLAAGVEMNYATALVYKRRLQALTAHVKYWLWEIKLRVLGAFSVSYPGEPLVQSGKDDRRTLDMLKTIVTYGGREVAIDHLSVVLWPDADGDSAEGVLDMAIHRLHKLFDNADAIAVSSGKVGFNMYLYGLDL